MKKLNYHSDYFIAGVDEVGRGPLAGPVISAAVILNLSYHIPGLTDSKKLSFKNRLFIFNIITKQCLDWSIGRSEVNEIDNINIFQATMLSMKRAIEGLTIKPNIILIDGTHCPIVNIPTKPLIKGDNFIPEISAASIVAKVIRDLEMNNLDILLPQYGFAKHKGYATKLHLNMINKYGITPYHRRSFSPVRKIMDQY